MAVSEEAVHLEVAEVSVAAAATTTVSAAAADKTLLVNDFENEVDLKAWEVKGPARLVAEGATHGTGALEMSWDAKTGPTYLKLVKPPADWSGYDALQLDVLNPGAVPVNEGAKLGRKAESQGTPQLDVQGT